MAIVASMTDTMPEDLAEAMMARGILALSGIPEALAALDMAAGAGRVRHRCGAGFVAGVGGPGAGVERSRGQGGFGGIWRGGADASRSVQADFSGGGAGGGEDRISRWC